MKKENNSIVTYTKRKIKQNIRENNSDYFRLSWNIKYKSAINSLKCKKKLKLPSLSAFDDGNIFIWETSFININSNKKYCYSTKNLYFPLYTFKIFNYPINKLELLYDCLFKFIYINNFLIEYFIFKFYKNDVYIYIFTGHFDIYSYNKTICNSFLSFNFYINKKIFKLYNYHDLDGLVKVFFDINNNIRFYMTKDFCEKYNFFQFSFLQNKNAYEFYTSFYNHFYYYFYLNYKLRFISNFLWKNFFLFFVLNRQIISLENSIYFEFELRADNFIFIYYFYLYINLIIEPSFFSNKQIKY